MVSRHDRSRRRVTAIDIRPNLKPLQRAFIALSAKQVPFAMSLALNTLAKGVVGIEREGVLETFDTPTPFTLNAFRMEAATKASPRARVAVKDIQAAYLEPYVVGGNRSLGTKRGMIVPRSVGVNQYGNLRRGKLAALKAKPNVFIGQVTFRNGKRAGQPIYGVWQRSDTPRGKRHDGDYGTRGNSQGKVYGARTTLKLLIEFDDTSPVAKHLDFYGAAERYVRANASQAFDAALRRALATARPK